MQKGNFNKARSKVQDNGVLEEKISLAECRSLMNRNGIEYSDEEIKWLRDFFYLLADIVYGNHIRAKEKEANKQMLKLENYDPSKSHPLHPGEHRRAS